MLRRTRAEEAPTDKEIALRAYQIWEQEGRPEGCDKAHWRRAEQELIGRQRQEDRAVRGWEKAAGIFSKRHRAQR